MTTSGEGILGKDYIKSLIKYLPDVNMVSYKTKFSTKSDIFKSKFIDKNLNKSFFSKYFSANHWNFLWMVLLYSK